MKVTIPGTFALEVDYNEAYVLHNALTYPRLLESLTIDGVKSVEKMREQLGTLLSLASGATGESIPWLRIEEKR